MEQYLVRDAVSGDLAFVIASWVKTLRGQSHLSLHISDDDLWSGIHDRVHFLFKDASRKFKVACDNEQPDLILGWAIVDGETVLGAYTKKPFRRMGIMRTLLERSGIDFTKPIRTAMYTKDAASVAKKYRLQFNWMFLLEKN